MWPLARLQALIDPTGHQSGAQCGWGSLYRIDYPNGISGHVHCYSALGAQGTPMSPINVHKSKGKGTVGGCFQKGCQWSQMRWFTKCFLAKHRWRMVGGKEDGAGKRSLRTASLASKLQERLGDCLPP